MRRDRRRPTAPTRRPVVAEDLLRLRILSDPQIAPDGSAVAFVKTFAGEGNRYRSNLWVVPATGRGAARPLTQGGGDRLPRWSPAGDRLAFVRAVDGGRGQLMLLPAAGGEAAPLTALPEGSIGSLQWTPDGRSLLFTWRPADPERTGKARRKREESGASEPPRILTEVGNRLDGAGWLDRPLGLYEVEVASGRTRRLFEVRTADGFEFALAPDGRRIAVAANLGRKAWLRPWHRTLHLLDRRDGRRRGLQGLPEGPKTRPLWSPDGRRLAWAGVLGHEDNYTTENLGLWVAEVRGGRAARARNLTAEHDLCLLAFTATDTSEIAFAPHFCWHPDGKRLLASFGVRGATWLAEVTLEGRLRWLARGFRESIPGNLDASGRRLALTISSPTTPPEVHVGEWRRDGLARRRRTAANRAWLREVELARPRPFTVRSADGSRVHGWRMEPPRRPARRRVPAVLSVHGGPHGQYGAAFFHEFQVLAGAGIAVFYGNPRGSKGYGRDFCAAIRGAWGGKDWEDVQALAAAMRATDFVDPDRVGIQGGSYGGWMVNWAIGHSREFRAAIADRSVTNLVSMLGTTDLPVPPEEYWPGNPWDAPEALWEQSPLRLARQVRTPLLLIHGEGDLRCAVEQAEQWFRALRLNGVRCRFVRYPQSSSHGMSRCGPPDLRLHRLGEVLAWWQETLT